MSGNSVEVDVAFLADGSKLLALITYTNTSSELVFLDKINGCLNQEVQNNVFTLTMDNKPIKYIGKYRKRRRSGPEDYVRLPGGKKLSTEVYIHDSYDFLIGLHAYTGYYSALHAYKDRLGFFELKSKPVEFSFRR